ncbi:hypothetical protein OIE63_39330 (plasmid) [Streptomyces sp. NBC_01795]|uniref:hypothetical protein n=1 Tax=unclassified Streptomyces TaxID=2593676 RepID=UPI002DDA7D90|nr:MULTISPECIES: hypothetical protein [unclassified Streptomyces]WSA97579.1 hypothetical protein OIE63_39330 [Streptomyces sp. NBC_01795]WSB82173.1 hypothetical protein OHB04_41485 [Streptomyces sp. NBC_01775]WSS18144.1 hypothetical protein OG533_40565 [Streptomyces sp. NBC_01186]
MPEPHATVMEIVRASMNPACRTTTRRTDHPACRVMAREAHADADDGGMDRVLLLATGTAASATAVTTVLAQESDQTPETLVDSMESAAAARGKEFSIGPVLRGMLTDHGGPGAEELGKAFARDQGEFYDLVVELADYTASCIQMRAVKFRVPVRESLNDLNEMLKDFVSA